MKNYRGITAFYAQNQRECREQLENNHASEKSVWLMIYKKQSGIPSVYYPKTVDKALCLGWIDSTPNKRCKQLLQIFRKTKSQQ
jgi:uncharacterized protein YdeI (YjbR/CyaY-like superfamily)